MSNVHTTVDEIASGGLTAGDFAAQLSQALPKASTGDAGWTVVGSGGTAPAYMNGWIAETAAGGTGWTDLQFRKDGQNAVFLEGGTNPTSATGDQFCNLPAGYRPAARLGITCFTGDANGGNGVIVESSGSIHTGNRSPNFFHHSFYADA